MPPVSKSVPRIPYPPSPKVNANSTKQGIGTILRTDPEKNNKSPPSSIRRTLSADMSSKKWLEQNGFPFAPTMKKIASFKELAVNHHPDSSSSSESDEEERSRPGRDDIWRTIQQGKEQNAAQTPNIWGSLIHDQKEDQSTKSVYVHPLVKRSASTLSEKSLEICTESLGSETGSDCFASYPGSEEDENVEKEEVQKTEPVIRESDPFEDLQVQKYKFSPVRPFPPPIPSIAGGDGASLQMHSKRENGRLVLEAVTVPARNYFRAERRDGRLVLTMMNSPNEEVEENKEEVFGDMEEVGENVENVYDGGYYEEDEDEEEEEEKIEESKKNTIVKEFELVKSTRSSSSGMISVHKTGLMMKKLVAQGNQNPTWTNKVVNMIVEDEGLAVPQSLPQAPLVARLIPSQAPSAAASFNAYDYFWRKSTVVTPKIVDAKPLPIKNYNTKINGANQDLVIIKEKKADHFAPYLRACKDGRRSLLIWEPYCIATS